MSLPWVRNALADRYIECEVARLIAYNVAHMQGQGLVPNKEASISKVFGSETAQRTARTCMDSWGCTVLWAGVPSGRRWPVASRITGC
jgi:alkylation response protein AidB-like acyl-CoA dehydrogenase